MVERLAAKEPLISLGSGLKKNGTELKREGMLDSQPPGGRSMTQEKG